ncbi:hypothetical protein KCV26_09390 [Petrimonas sulfuriphila]|uniref:hypothetical protein n=1 Tax=Petrimonas sulfuriphila TaxID=285070 RepID=UPI0032432AAD
MDKTLKSIYLRLDSTNKSLTKAAISQLLIKIIYASNNPLSEKQIIAEYKSILNVKNLDDNEIRNCLSLLVEDSSITLHKGRYHISTSKREKIDSSYQESERRKVDIIETYFKPFFSDEKAVKEWLEDITVSFFQLYSNEWIADLCYKRMSAISGSKESILDSINRRTLNNEQIEKKEQKDLCEKFVRFITTKDSVVDSYLWEYGTSSFSAQLIKNSVGADDISIETFKDCKCVLDTNILMHIGLESSEYYPSFKSLEEVFQSLNIEVGVLYITKEEYKNTVGNKRDEILRMVEKYQLDVIKEADDQYTKTAIARRCRTYSDFERFFSQLLEIPQYIEEKVRIELFDHDPKLEEVIEKSQNDEQKQSELNAIFYQITGHDKRQNALIHDVGLIAGVNYLREQGKYFILSQEVSVNNYAKQKPSVQDLPMSIKLETIINVLAVNNGGVNIDATDYIPLFASMVRRGLIPNRDAFKVADLSLMLEKNEQIAQLPSEETIRIAKDVHRKRLLGENEDKIALEMTREIQGVKMQLVDDLEETKTKLTLEQQEKGRYKQSADKTTNALRETIKAEVEKVYRKKIRNKRLLFYLIFPILIFFLSAIGFYAYYMYGDNSNNFWSYIVPAVIVNLLTDILIIMLKGLPEIRQLKKDRTNWVEDEVNKRLRKKLED